MSTVVFIADHQLVPARTVAETAYRAHPSLRSLLLLANAMQLQGRFKHVVAMLNAKRSLYKDSAPFLITLAESEFDSILYGAAQRDLQHALVLDPGSYQAHFLLGNALLKLDHADDAAGEYRRAIALSPQQPRTYYQLALALQAQQNQPGAEEQLTKALALDAHYGPALIEISKMLIAQHRPADAVNRLTVAIQDNPRSEQGYFLLARAYAQLGDQQKREEMGKQLILVRNSNAQGSGNMDHRQRDGQPIANP